MAKTKLTLSIEDKEIKDLKKLAIDADMTLSDYLAKAGKIISNLHYIATTTEIKKKGLFLDKELDNKWHLEHSDIENRLNGSSFEIENNPGKVIKMIEEAVLIIKSKRSKLWQD